MRYYVTYNIYREQQCELKDEQLNVINTLTCKSLNNTVTTVEKKLYDSFMSSVYLFIMSEFKRKILR